MSQRSRVSSQKLRATTASDRRQCCKIAGRSYRPCRLRTQVHNPPQICDMHAKVRGPQKNHRNTLWISLLLARKYFVARNPENFHRSRVRRSSRAKKIQKWSNPIFCPAHSPNLSRRKAPSLRRELSDRGWWLQLDRPDSDSPQFRRCDSAIDEC